MRQFLRPLPARVTVMALLALLVALAATSYAASDIGDGSPTQPARADSPLATSHTGPAAFSTFKDSFTLTTQANQRVTVARLPVPAGRYVVVAKLYLGPPTSGLSEAVMCDLTAGADFDRSTVNHDATIAFVSASFNVVHRYKMPGTVFLRCTHAFSSGSAPVQFIKITAIRVETLSNVQSP
jgi:hypothetical protein